MRQIQVLLVEDDENRIKEVKKYLKNTNDINITAHAKNKKEAILLANRLNLDIVLLDAFLDGEPVGLTVAAEMNKSCRANILMLMEDNSKNLILEAFQAGAISFISKEQLSKISEIIHSVYNHGFSVNVQMAEAIREEIRRLRKLEVDYIKSRFTPTELKILKLIAQGYKRREIAEKLFIEEMTVKNHIHNILQKTKERRSRTVAAKMRELKLI